MEYVTKFNQIKQRVRVETTNGNYTGILIEEHNRNFKKGCVDLLCQGEIASLGAGGKVLGFKPGMKKMSIPRQNIRKVVTI